ncbi:MAG: protein phosphatase CheZ [Deltaproteobacteria bacterium]|nr:protein phosphatase CheZ [Deltaproteobacteria bacterium]
MAKTKEKKSRDHVDNILGQAEALKEYLEKEGPESIEQLIIFMDTLKESIIALTTGDLKKASESMKKLSTIAATDLFRGIGEITRELHESIKDIQKFLEPILTNISEEDVQGLTSKLAYVSNIVKDTSERTLDLLFSRQEIALGDNMAYDKIARLIVSDDKKGALLKIKELKTHNSELVGELMRISELQIHADLVDQIIKKVSKVVDNMERRLVDLIRRYGHHAGLKDMGDLSEHGTRLHGPAIPGEEKGVASSQDDVDSLLKALDM